MFGHRFFGLRFFGNRYFGGVGPVTISPTGFADGESFGSPSFFLEQTIAPTGFTSADAFGAPTIGRVKTKGTGGGGTGGGVGAGQKYGTQLTMTEAGLIITLRMQSSVAKTVNTRMGLYADSSGLPGALLAQSDAKTSVVIGNNDYSMLVPYAAASGQVLWPALQSDGNFTWFLTSGGSSRFNGDLFSDGISNPFGVSTLQSNKAPLFLVFTEAIALTIAPSGFVDGESFGSPSLFYQLQTIAATGFSSADAFGAPSIKGQNTLALTGFANGEAFGSPAFIPVVPQTITATGFADGELFGSATFGVVSVTISATGFANGEAFGSPAFGQAETFAPAGFSSADAFGTPDLTVRALTTLPSNRIIYVAAEDRLQALLSELRSAVATDSDRTISVAAEDRDLELAE